jgi:glycosyltransferase involved in cell wall biosynthesis
MKFSVVVICKNEQEMLKACLESVKWADEILVIDNGSTDKTSEIARNQGVRVIRFESDDFSKTRNKGMEEAKGEWVLYVDADERVLKPLHDEIRELVAGTGFSAFALSRINIIFGQKVNYGPYKKDWMIRLFKKSEFEGWVGKVHEYGKFKGELGYSKNSLLHLTHRDLDHFMQKALEWSKIDAKLRFDANHPKMTRLRFMRILMTESWNQLIKRKGLFAGTVGFVDSTLQIISFHITYIRLWQMQQPKPIDETYKEIDKKLLENRFEFKE